MVNAQYDTNDPFFNTRIRYRFPDGEWGALSFPNPKHMRYTYEALLAHALKNNLPLPIVEKQTWEQVPINPASPIFRAGVKPVCGIHIMANGRWGCPLCDVSYDPSENAPPCIRGLTQ